MNTKWLIWSNEHKQWWKPNSMGYTSIKENAGQYDIDEAMEVCADANIHCPEEPNETMVPDA